ncbi:LOW QUALITY PROTEIN: regulatory factor X-associated protein [Scyliorhinus canicula]|uniref:LOW QUALITY PROTEIN: regulatory factor X-associated protein n=1 Tax=Scyliorhinus canicula TaxID=7830 RepID=UPI0018F55AC7|nr:LOW QUALITY PROTEIN: regulatory factor X-associated protein [Scyliorhinus canicula]
MSESRKNSEEPPTLSPRSVSHQELTTVAMDAAFSETSQEGGGGGGGGDMLVTPDNRESPGEGEDNNNEEEEEEDEDDDEEDEEEEEMLMMDDEEEEDEEDEESGHSETGDQEMCVRGMHRTTSQVAKPRKPWMCKKHRNTNYKDKYKKRKSDMVNIHKSNDDTDDRPKSATKQRLSCMIVQQTNRKASLLEQVLNQKRLSLLRSPEVVQFLQQQQRLLSNQALAQRQQFQENQCDAFFSK